MLRRNNSDRLGWRKSTTSIHSKHESNNPELVRQHAQTAATLAFARAQDRKKADVGYRGNRHSRSNSTLSYTDRPALSHQAQHEHNLGQGIRRQHSVRFVGPHAVQQRQSFNSRAAQPSLESKASSTTLRPLAMTTSAPVPAAYRPPSRSSSIGKTSTGRGRPESLLNAAAAYNEYYTPEDDIASTPSSYRRIRRSKSMYSPLKAPSVFYTNGTPEQGDGSQFSSYNPLTSSQPPQMQPYEAPLRLQKSMSLLRGGRRDHSAQGRNDEAVQMARDRFFQQTTQQRLREQPSFLFRSKSHRQEKTFRKSVRSTSSNDPDSSSHFEQAKGSGFRVKARRASSSLKQKFRKAFRLHKEPVDIPNQQVDARETHVRKYNGDQDVRRNRLEDIPRPNEATLSRVAARPPSLHEASSNQQLRSYAGSVKSTCSDCSADKSGVTTWNSTAVNTLTSQAARLQAERELQRLSIINENGTHISSSSFARPKINQTSAYPHHHRTSKSTSNVPSPGTGAVDSARVYSALMKRLDENTPKAKLEASRNSSAESFIPAIRLRQRSSSLNSSQRSRTPATIRHVLPDDSDRSSSHEGPKHEHQWVRADSIHSARAEDIFGVAGTHVHQWVTADLLRETRMRQEDDVFSLNDAPVQSSEIDAKTQRYLGRPDITTHDLSRQASTKASYYTVPESFGLTPQEISNFNEAVVQPARLLRESRSTFFGGTSMVPTRTTSPFRRALAESDYRTSNATAVPLSNESVSNPLYIGPFSPYMAVGDGNYSQGSDKAYSESVYSRTTSGPGPAAANSTLSLLRNEENLYTGPPLASTGEVVITDNMRFSYRPSMPAQALHRATSSNGSTEWKAWMSSEVSKLERAKENTNASASYVNYTLPTMPKAFHVGHIRESAQISDDNTDPPRGDGGAGKQPLGVIQQQRLNMQSVPHIVPQNQQLLKPILKNRSTTSLVENINSSVVNRAKTPIPTPPPIPVRSPLRVTNSKSSLRSVNTFDTDSGPGSIAKVLSSNGKNLLHKRNGSTTALKSMKSVGTPAKLVKKLPSKRSPSAHQPSPENGLATAIDKQLRRTSTRSRTPGSTWNINRENHHPDDSEKDFIYGTDGAGLMGPAEGSGKMNELDAQQLGSKRMVDLFLSSRRRRVAGSEDSDAMFL